MALIQELKMKAVALYIGLVLLSYNNVSTADSYEAALASWTSHKDVAKWLSNNFSFEKSRQKQISKRLRQQGPDGLLIRKPVNLYENNHNGYCADSANFSIQSLNKINPAYNARWVFIWNKAGRPNHWVAAFDHENKLYIRDYGTGDKWKEMQGIHGPYNSLGEYRSYLASLEIPNFKVGEVRFRDMPGQED